MQSLLFAEGRRGQKWGQKVTSRWAGDRAVRRRSRDAFDLTRNTPRTPRRDPNAPVSLRSEAYTETMRTAEIRGIQPQRRIGEPTETTIICSWFESRYPSTKRCRIPRRNRLSPILRNRPETGRITVNRTNKPSWGLFGRCRACAGPRNGPVETKRNRA